VDAVWPFQDLRVVTPRLELRLPDDGDLRALADLAAAGVHPPGEMPFLVPWTAAPPDELRRGFLQYHWGLRGSLSPEDWSLAFAIRHDGRLVGMQDVGARQFAVRRTVDTGSWLGQAFQGHGIGTEMRAAVLHLAFAGLGALRAETSAMDGNERSAGVSRRLGYRPDGESVDVVAGRRRIGQRYALSLAGWQAATRIPVEIVGLEPCLPLLGAG
jgi:RimJ/RimL family protein N-acetyltransferase